MMDMISNPLIVSYLALAIAVLTAIRVFIPGESDSNSQASPAPAPVAAPVVVPAAAPAAVSPPTQSDSEDEAVIAAIVAAVAMCTSGGFAIKSIRPAQGGGNLWSMAGRIENTASL